MNMIDFWARISEEEESYWISNERIAQWPFIVASEYVRLHEECRRTNPYAVQILIKDIMETLLKYHVLSICAWIDSAQGNIQQDLVESFHNAITCELTKSGISLGDWEALGIEIRRHMSDFNQEESAISVLFEPLKEILSFFVHNQIVAWRNKNIGHGALANADDSDFRDDIIKKLVAIKRLLERIDAFLMRQRILLDGVGLIGPNYRKVYSSSEDSELTLSLIGEKATTSFSLKPYLVVKFGNVYFFDNQKEDKLTNRLSYRDGKHVRERNQLWFSQLYWRLQAKNGNLHIDMNQASDSPFLTEHENTVLGELRQGDFITPVALKSWLTNALSRNARGIFLLEMPRGTGKSSFTEELHCLNQNPKIRFDGIDVRTYHIHRAQLRKDAADDFQRECESLWSHTYEGANWARYPRIMDIMKSGSADMTPAQAFAGFLNKIRANTERTRGIDKILMVIDGIDEIDSPELRDYILMCVKDLDEGVYVLLTSRPADDGGQNEQLSDATRSALKQIEKDCTAQLSVALDSESNMDLLYAFLDTIHVTLTEAQRKALVQQADQRILYLKLLGMLLESGVKTETLIADGSVVIEQYLSALLDNRSERDAAMMNELLVLLSCVARFVPLTLKELSTLLGLPGITFSFIGAINDLTPMLKTQRGQSLGFAVVGEKNYYTLANPDLCSSVWGYVKSREWEEYLLQLVFDCVSNAVEKSENIREVTENDHICLKVLANLQGLLGLCEKGFHSFVNAFSLLNRKIVSSTDNLDYDAAEQAYEKLMNVFAARQMEDEYLFDDANAAKIPQFGRAAGSYLNLLRQLLRRATLAERENIYQIKALPAMKICMENFTEAVDISRLYQNMAWVDTEARHFEEAFSHIVYACFPEETTVSVYSIDEVNCCRVLGYTGYLGQDRQYIFNAYTNLMHALLLDKDERGSLMLDVIETHAHAFTIADTALLTASDVNVMANARLASCIAMIHGSSASSRAVGLFRKAIEFALDLDQPLFDALAVCVKAEEIALVLQGRITGPVLSKQMQELNSLYRRFMTKAEQVGIHILDVDPFSGCNFQSQNHEELMKIALRLAY